MKPTHLLLAFLVAASHLTALGDTAPSTPPSLDDPDPVIRLRSRAEAAALVLLVEAEPNGNQTRFKIAEYWKRKAPEDTITKYFGDSYLPFVFPSRLQAGQRILAFYFLPSHTWGSPTDSPLAAGLLNGKFTFNQSHQTKPAQEYSAAELRRLLSNDKEPFVFPESVCRIK
jgi:hypothetical protein